MSSNVVQLFPNGRPGADAPKAEDYCDLLGELSDYGTELARMVQQRTKAQAGRSADQLADGAVAASGLDALGALACIARALRLARRLTRLLAIEPLPAKPALHGVLLDIGRDLGIAAQFGTHPRKQRTPAYVRDFCALAARTSAAPRRPRGPS